MSRYLSARVAKLKVRTLTESLLAVTLLAAAWYFLLYVPKHVKTGEPVVELTNYFLTYAPIEGVNQPAYVLPSSAKVWDTPAEIREQIATLQSGEQVQALGRFRDWTHVRTLAGQDGWVSASDLMNAETHAAEDRLCREISDAPVQAGGHAGDVDNVHIEPSRQAAIVAEVNPEQTLEIFGRRMVPRSGDNGASGIPSTASRVEAWYLIRQGSRAGWILGRRFQLDIPKSLSAYSEGTNLVAWVVINTVNDDGRPVPQYLVADRVGNNTCDFTDIRVLTWWKRKQTYAIAYKEGDLQGYFPILVAHEGSVPQFRLRLVDDTGAKCQQVYGLYDTITRLIGIAGTWQADAIPAPRPPRTKTAG
jgi:hypothetical protein